MGIIRAVLQPYALVILASLFLAFSNVFVPKYFLEESEFRDFRLFFNIASIFGPLLLLGVDLAVGFIELKKLLEFSKLYLMVAFAAVIFLVFTENTSSVQNARVLYGALCVGAINLVASLMLKVGRINSYYFFSQIYIKIIPLSVMFFSIYYTGVFDLDSSVFLACILLTLPSIGLLPYFWSREYTPPSIKALDARVVGLVFGTLAVDMVLKIPYLLSLGGDPAVTNIIDIVTAFTSILLYPAMLYSRKIEISSKMRPATFYEQIGSGYTSISGLQCVLTIIGGCSLLYVEAIGLIKYDQGLLVKAWSGLGFSATAIAVIPNFIKIYISNGLINSKYSLILLCIFLLLATIFSVGYISDPVLVSVIFVTLFFGWQYMIALEWTKSNHIFLNKGSFVLALLFLLVFACSYQYG